MSQLSAIIHHNGQVIHQSETSIENPVNLEQLVKDLRSMQKNTNEFLTGMLTNSNDRCEEDDEEEEDDDDVQEPEPKMMKSS